MFHGFILDPISFLTFYSSRFGRHLIDELADLQQDQEEAGIANANLGGRRTRGVKIDFAGKTLPGEKEGAVDEDDDEDDDAEVDGENKGEKGKGKPVSKAGGSSKPASKVASTKTGGSGSKPASKA